MVSSDFAVFILTHGRPDNVITYRTLMRQGYTGRLYFIVDNEDRTIDKYKESFGADRVIVFDKSHYIRIADTAHNFSERRSILYARNACFDIANDLGLKYFIQLDDDYGSFLYRNHKHGVTIKNINIAFEAMLSFYKSTPVASIAMSQGGDHIGGFAGERMKRKCMNSFLCGVDRRFDFVGAMNDDVNTYVVHGSRGVVFFTYTGLQLNQAPTQKQAAGLTDMYLRFGTFSKSFTTVIMSPASVRVSMMSTTNTRIHHLIKWANTVPAIIDEVHRKTT